MNLRINTLEEKIIKLENEIAEEAVKIVQLGEARNRLFTKFNTYHHDKLYVNSMSNVIQRHEEIVKSKLEIVRKYKHEIQEIREKEENIVNA